MKRSILRRVAFAIVFISALPMIGAGNPVFEVASILSGTFKGSTPGNDLRLDLRSVTTDPQHLHDLFFECTGKYRSWRCWGSVVTERKSRRRSFPGVEPLNVPERIDATSKTGLPAPIIGSAEIKTIAKATLLKIERFMKSSGPEECEIRSMALRGPQLSDLKPFNQSCTVSRSDLKSLPEDTFSFLRGRFEGRPKCG